ncbi:hypothetical protein EDC01DRAFT_630716 [Geopyxis carbonaria]|nr:hypothetical protein EDC01DRAFT_630716 [Geopyxis carbonaria]
MDSDNDELAAYVLSLEIAKMLAPLSTIESQETDANQRLRDLENQAELINHALATLDPRKTCWSGQIEVLETMQTAVLQRIVEKRAELATLDGRHAALATHFSVLMATRIAMLHDDSCTPQERPELIQAVYDIRKHSKYLSTLSQTEPNARYQENLIYEQRKGVQEADLAKRQREMGMKERLMASREADLAEKFHANAKLEADLAQKQQLIEAAEARLRAHATDTLTVFPSKRLRLHKSMTNRNRRE